MRVALIDFGSVARIVWTRMPNQGSVQFDRGFFSVVADYIESLLGDINPTHATVIVEDYDWLDKRSSYPDYTPNGSFHLPPSAIFSLVHLKNRLDELGVDMRVCPRCEPYDVMAMFVSKMPNGADLHLVTSDVRSWTLVDEERVCVTWPFYEKHPVVNKKTVSEKTGLTPEQFRDLIVMRKISDVDHRYWMNLLKEFGSLKSIFEVEQSGLDSEKQNLIEILSSNKEVLRKGYHFANPLNLKRIGVKLSDIKYFGYRDDGDELQSA